MLMFDRRKAERALYHWGQDAEDGIQTAVCKLLASPTIDTTKDATGLVIVTAHRYLLNERKRHRRMLAMPEGLDIGRPDVDRVDYRQRRQQIDTRNARALAMLTPADRALLTATLSREQTAERKRKSRLLARIRAAI